MTLFDPLDFPALLVALAVDALAGYPAWLGGAIGHPVVWIGWLIERLDRRFNLTDLDEIGRRTLGAASLAVVMLAAGGVAALVMWGARAIPFGWVLEALVASSLLAQRSLHDHVAAVATALEQGGLVPARRAVSAIVGRNPETLDEAGVARAAIESLAENFSDGVAAPAFWFAAAGLPGIAVYKAINTADSMIGHMTPRHRAFGWASARLDDLVNLPASRLAAFCFFVASFVVRHGSPAGTWRAVRRDARLHRSPNAGWPEAAMAGALGLKLAGPRTYGTERVVDAWMGDGRAEANASDIRAALGLYRAACGVLWGLAGIGFLVFAI